MIENEIGVRLRGAFFFFLVVFFIVLAQAVVGKREGQANNKHNKKKGRIVCVAKAAFEAFATETRVPLFK